MDASDNGKKFFIVVGITSVIFLTSFGQTEGIQCYQCQDDSKDEDIQPCHGTGMVSECPAKFHLCSIARDPDGQIFRSCLDEGKQECKSDENLKNENGAEGDICICDHDNCNREWSVCCPEAQRPNLISDHVEKHGGGGSGAGGGGGKGVRSSMPSETLTIVLSVIIMLSFAYGQV